MNRKDFILQSAFSAIAISTFGNIVPTKQGTFHGDCETTNDILGPFYRAGAPLRSDLTTATLMGTRIYISGKVKKKDCVTPIKGALVEIWHCDSKGEYDNDSQDFNQRASFITSENGEYAFKTILPGKYLNGELFRPSHIHFRVSGNELDELISQIYFEHDPDIVKDPWASKPQAKERILPLIPSMTDGSLSIQFDIYC